jgi:putative tryptophan/tyrosine transport system substrate-binding protein
LKKTAGLHRYVLIGGLVSLGILFLLSFSSGTAAYSPRAARIPAAIAAVMTNYENSEYKSAVEGFADALKERKIRVDLRIYRQIDAQVVREIQSQPPALILTASSSAVEFLSEHIKDIPIIFTMLIDPWGSGIASRNIVGASLHIPAKRQLEILKTAVPRIKRVGVIYNDTENQRIIKEAASAAQDLDMVLKTYPVKSTSEIPELKDLGIDALWLIPDTTVCQAPIIRRILLSSIKERIPVMGFSPAYARAGALLAVSCDYKDIGRQSGELAARILQGENYSCLKISAARKTKLYVNQLVADRMGIRIPGELLQQVDEVFGK